MSSGGKRVNNSPIQQRPVDCKVGSLAELRQLLWEEGIETSQWSHQQGNKTIEDLWREISIGESYLKRVEGKLTRLLRVSAVEVIFTLGERRFQLVEDKQIFLNSGIVRQRELNVITEKIRGRENPLSAAYRGLMEEVNLKVTTPLNFLGETYWQKISPSYPHLSSLYQVFHYQAILGERELITVRFSEYREQENILSLFTLKPLH
ncbi:MAG: hypothetical protein NZ901_00090 [Geminocystis sp.]|nr:hypothetical protein [Geminocystis sp.]HIK38807.1 hypothetical protein [Geminocystis sp. M7585_C2015_104]MCS7146566.1 hypothetical protein [Geminocystis sp.]MCX8078641.1 hypothetical protein [Geminocystis sp.]MDW8115336.1 hypothetical protein [Geminocystis sp.]